MIEDQDDDEFARYLASYLVQRQDDFAWVDLTGVLCVGEDNLFQLIKQFRQELP